MGVDVYKPDSPIQSQQQQPHHQHSKPLLRGGLNGRDTQNVSRELPTEPMTVPVGSQQPLATLRNLVSFAHKIPSLLINLKIPNKFLPDLTNFFSLTIVWIIPLPALPASTSLGKHHNTHM